MKKMYKRFISISMAIIMISSYSVVSLAKEDTGTVNEELSVNIISDYFEELIDRQSGISTSTPLEIPFTIPQSGTYLYFTIAATTSVYVDVHRSNGLSVTGKNINSPGEDTKTYELRYPTVYHYWPAGNYVLTVEFKQPDQGYAFTLIGSSSELDSDG